SPSSVRHRSRVRAACARSSKQRATPRMVSVAKTAPNPFFAIIVLSRPYLPVLQISAFPPDGIPVPAQQRNWKVGRLTGVCAHRLGPHERCPWSLFFCAVREPVFRCSLLLKTQQQLHQGFSGYANLVWRLRETRRGDPFFRLQCYDFPVAVLQQV